MAKNKVIIALILLVMVISVSGCNATNLNNNGSTNKPNKTQTTEQTPTFDEKYTDVEGVLTFRGNNFRSGPAFGNADIKKGTLTELWSFKTAAGGAWGSGAGWTGQPALVKWSKQVKQTMNIDPKYVNDDNFVEVIQASLNGKIYFFDMKTGEQTRPEIDLPNPIKGSVSVDPRGYPLLYVGQGIDTVDKIGFYIFSLIDQKPLYFKNGHDKNSPRHWPYFDSSALFDKDTDTVFVCGENGLVYKVKLNTVFDPAKKLLKISPKYKWFSTKPGVTGYPTTNQSIGIENSPAAYKDKIFFGDNSGMIRCLNTDLKLQWEYKNLDDTDASIVVEVENGVPMLYTGCEVDKQGNPGTARIVKLNGDTGKVVWKREFKCGARYGASPSNGGLLGTPVNGKGPIKNLLIFTLCRYPSFDTGAMIALDKATGETKWEHKMNTYAWPSPVDFYDKATGKAYILQNDHNGTSWIFDGTNGNVVSSKKVGYYMEASPSIFNNYVVFATRDGFVKGFKLN